MHKEITTQAKPKKDEREEVLKEIRQLENRQKILENKQRNEERKARTRRLIERGAILEGVFPLAPGLHGVEVKAFLIALSHLPGARGKMPSKTAPRSIRRRVRTLRSSFRCLFSKIFFRFSSCRISFRTFSRSSFWGLGCNFFVHVRHLFSLKILID